MLNSILSFKINLNSFFKKNSWLANAYHASDHILRGQGSVAVVVKRNGTLLIFVLLLLTSLILCDQTERALPSDQFVKDDAEGVHIAFLGALYDVAKFGLTEQFGRCP